MWGLSDSERQWAALGTRLRAASGKVDVVVWWMR